jgi:tetratricopeptide (TPR) repeat protein
MAGEWEQAIDSLSIAIGLTETEWWGEENAYYRRGDSYLELDQYQLAISDFSKAIELDPDWYLPYWAWGVAYHEQGDYDAAILGFDVAIALDPYANHYDWRGTAHYFLGEYQLALQDFDMATQLEPDVGLYYENSGNMHDWLGQSTEAETDWAKACSLDSQYC